MQDDLLEKLGKAEVGLELVANRLVRAGVRIEEVTTERVAEHLLGYAADHLGALGELRRKLDDAARLRQQTVVPDARGFGQIPLSLDGRGTARRPVLANRIEVLEQDAERVNRRVATRAHLRLGPKVDEAHLVQALGLASDRLQESGRRWGNVIHAEELAPHEQAAMNDRCGA